MLSRIDDSVAVPGDILVAKGTVLPDTLSLEHRPGPSGWASIAKRPSAGALGDQLAAAGWTFLYLAGSVRITSFGFNRRAMVHQAVRRLIAVATLQKCNCLQIERVVFRSFLGVHCVTVSAHSRHIQKQMASFNA